MTAHEYYLKMLNKIASLSPAVAASVAFADFVSAAYDEDGNIDEEIGHISMLHMFLCQVEDIASSFEFEEMMKVYDLNKIYNSPLIETAQSLEIVNGVLIDHLLGE